MLRSLLSETFGLQMHEERRELSIYALVVTKGGPKLRRVDNPDKARKLDAGLLVPN